MCFKQSCFVLMFYDFKVCIDVVTLWRRFDVVLWKTWTFRHFIKLLECLNALMSVYWLMIILSCYGKYMKTAMQRQVDVAWKYIRVLLFREYQNLWMPIYSLIIKLPHKILIKSVLLCCTFIDVTTSIWRCHINK